MFKKFILGLFLLCLSNLSAQAQPAGFANIADKVMGSVVNISARIDEDAVTPEIINGLMFTDPDGRTALGSGFIFDPRGFIATCAHVLENTHQISVTLSDGQIFPAEIVGYDLLTDLAVLKIQPSTALTPVVFGNVGAERIGDWVLAAGSPFGLGNSVTAGILSGKTRRFEQNTYTEYFQTDAVLAPGYSGGPLFNTNGEVIGVHNALLTTNGGFQGVSLALSADDAEEVLQRLKQSGHVARVSLGATFAIRENGQVTVVSLHRPDVAAQNNLQPGDVILEINGHSASGEKQFLKQIALSPAGTEFELKILRNGQPFIQTVRTFSDEEQPVLPDEEESIPLITEPEPVSSAGIQTDGTTVLSVEPGSPAAQKGIEAGDIVLKVNGEKLGDPEDLKFYLEEAAERHQPFVLQMQNAQTNEPYEVEILTDDENYDQN